MIHLLLNSDFMRPAVVVPSRYEWVASPQPGVDRVMLDRIGGEKARATSIVRYRPGSRFPCHVHDGGEEILVLSGTFSEGAADYPAGCYLRNPPASFHQPSSAEGTLLFVKLGQMQPTEREAVRADSRGPARWLKRGHRQVCPLYSGEAPSRS